MFGEIAFELIKELKRCQDGIILPFNEDIVRQVLEEMKLLFEENHKDVTASGDGGHGLFPGVQLRHAALERNKRILLTYLHDRSTKITDMRWQIGSILPPNIRSQLNDNEITWLQKYNKSLTSYMRLSGLDLTQNSKPPKSLLIQVKCTMEQGSIELTSGRTIHLSKGTHHFLERSECESLIARGIVEEV